MRVGLKRPITVALVIPLHGPAQIYGPSCTLSACLAVEEINEAGGLLGREVRVHIVDSSAEPHTVADEVDRLICAGRADAVVGWHLSALRALLAPRIAGRIPYIYTALYEGGDTSPGVFFTGETPDSQLHPALDWMAREVSTHRWFVVGNDYIWPRRSVAAVRRYARDHRRFRIDDEAYVGLGADDFDSVMRRIERSACDGVLMLLVGRDGVAFNQRFADRGLDLQCARLTPLMDESMLRESGVRATRDLFSTSGFFEALGTEDGLGFGARYTVRFGPDAPVLNGPGESCYEGVLLLAALMRQAGSAEIDRICETAEGTRYHGPRGDMVLIGRHVQQQVYLATADEEQDGFDVLTSI